MKTRINKLKLAMLVIGISALSICAVKLTDTALGNSKKAAELQQAHFDQLLDTTSGNLMKTAGKIQGAAIPIFIGTIEATLVSAQ